MVHEFAPGGPATWCCPTAWAGWERCVSSRPTPAPLRAAVSAPMPNRPRSVATRPPFSSTAAVSERQRGRLNHQRQRAHHRQHVFRHVFIHRYKANRIAAQSGAAEVERGDVDAGAGEGGSKPTYEARFVLIGHVKHVRR